MISQPYVDNIICDALQLDHQFTKHENRNSNEKIKRIEFGLEA